MQLCRPCLRVRPSTRRRRRPSRRRRRGPGRAPGAWPFFAFSAGKSCVALHEISFFCAATASALLTSSLFVTTAPTRSHSPSAPARAHTDSHEKRRLPLRWCTKKFSHCFSRSFLPVRKSTSARRWRGAMIIAVAETRRENLIYALALPGLTNFALLFLVAAPKPALSATPLRRCVGGTSADAPASSVIAARTRMLQRVASFLSQHCGRLSWLRAG